MRTPKEAALEVIRQLPDDCDVEDVLNQIYLLAQVMKGLRQAQSGQQVSREELLQQLQTSVCN